MKNIKLILGVVALIVIGSGLYYGYTVMEEKDQQRQQAEAKAKAEKTALEQQQAEAAALAARTKCADGDKYFVVAVDHEGGVGQDIQVKDKSAGTPECKLDGVNSVFEIKNSDPEYFKVQSEDALVTDIGTAPTGRSFRLYDLKDKNMVVEKKYFDELNISTTTLTYFGLSKTKADKKNCADFAQFTKDGLTPNLVVKKTIDLKTYSAKETKETKCVASQ